VEFAPQSICRAVQITERIVQLVFLLASNVLLRLGCCTTAFPSGRLGGFRLVLSVFGPVLRPVSKFIHAVFHFTNAIGDLCLRERQLRKGKSAYGQTYEDYQNQSVFL